jgi:hypothetical protein
MRYTDALFLNSSFLGSKFYPSGLETVAVAVPALYIRDLSLLLRLF